MSDITLECPRCERRHQGARIEDDPPEAVKALILCPDCCGGDFGGTTYLDQNGRDVDGVQEAQDEQAE